MREMMIWDFHSMRRRHSFVWTWNQSNKMITTSFFRICICGWLKKNCSEKLHLNLSQSLLYPTRCLTSMPLKFKNWIPYVNNIERNECLLSEAKVFMRMFIFLFHSPALPIWQHILPWQTGTQCQACVMQVWRVSRLVNISFRFKATCV